MSGVKNGEEMLLLFKERTLLVDDLIKMNAELKLKLGPKPPSAEKSSQCEHVETRSVLLQTESEKDANAVCEAKAKKTIKFFNFGKKLPKKRVKFIKSGRLENCDDGRPLVNHTYNPGHRPPFSKHDLAFVLPHASQIGGKKTAQKRKSLEDSKPQNKAKKAKTEKQKSPKKKNTEVEVNWVNIEKKSMQEAEKTKKKETVQKKIEKPLSKGREMPQTASGDTRAAHEVDKLKQAKPVDSESKANPKRASILVDEIIPLGKAHATPSQRTERSANFKLTPEALAAINARKVAGVQPKRPIQPLPKRLAVDNIDPTRKKKLLSRPVPKPLHEILSENTVDTNEDAEDIVSPVKTPLSKRRRILDDDEEDEDVVGNDLELSDEGDEPVSHSKRDESNGNLQKSNEEKITEAPKSSSLGTAVSSATVEAYAGAESLKSKSVDKEVPIVQQEEQPKKTDASSLDNFAKQMSMSFLERMIHKFKHDNAGRWQELQSKSSANRSKDQLNQEITHNVVRIQISRLWPCTSHDVLMNIVKTLTQHEKCNINKRLICQNIYQGIREEKEWVALVDQGSTKPKLTWKQIKALTLLIHLEPQMPGILNEMKNLIHKFLLTSKNGLQNYKLYQLANVTRFFLAVVRHQGDEERARLFIYDILFFRNTRSHVAINILLETWHELMIVNSMSTNADPVFSAIIWMIFNSGPETSLTDMKVHEAKNKLQRLCGVKKPEMTGDELIKQLIKITEDHQENEKLRFATKKALLLIGRWQEYKWTNNHIVSRLLDILKTSKSNAIMLWVIDTIGHLSRVYPVEGRDHLTSVFDSLTALIRQKDIDANMEEVCLRSIIWTGHHLQFQVADFLSKYEPIHPIRPKVEELIANFAGTRGKSFCENTLTKVKKLAIRRRKIVT